jgi:hypothetical protein
MLTIVGYRAVKGPCLLDDCSAAETGQAFSQKIAAKQVF